jgi:hypothetical protein
VLSGFSGIVVQALLFGVSVGSLLTKWWLEKPRRRFRIFFLDSSKQFLGAGVIHCLNLVCAVTFSHLQASAADECAWYWINIMIDTTFGVGVCWMLLKATEQIFGFDSGYYGKTASSGSDWEVSPQLGPWLAQISGWCVIVAVMKLTVVALMYSFAPLWEQLSITCTHWITNLNLRLVFVMIVTPTCMNMFQFCLTDSFLKYKNLKKFISESTPLHSSSASTTVQ